MSLKNVELFYDRLSNDEVFSAQLQGISKEDCNRIVKAAGYDFTQQEFEEYTAQMLDSQEMQSVDERELEAIVGGIKGFIGKPIIRPLYGVITPPSEFL
jgi:predicted ribosomally synthesized peptide with nif11-like leader